ncbi:MAG TPA: rhomboid family intramembrane serine protease [Candidatus Limnocylindrales bacterium]
MTQPPPPFDYHGTLAHDGPLSRTAALAALDHAAELMEQSRYLDAARLYQRVVGFDDRGVTSAALLGFGQAMHRLDDENAAIGAWQEVTQLPVTPATYPAWRELAGARVRSGDLAGAVEAYRQADRLAPREDKAEIASRLGWLSKELGDTSAAGRYFSRARGGSAIAMTIGIIAVTTIVSLVADIGGRDGSQLLDTLQMDKVAMAHGEAYRLLTVALVHAPLSDNPFHLLLNMYGLWLFGPYVERLYGRWRMLAFYLVTAVGASLLSFGLSDPSSSPFAVGASGALFGIIGVLVSALFVHRPALGALGRGLLANLVAIIAINLLFGATVAGIDNMAHIGGLLTGLWLGVLFRPTGVPTLHSLWSRPGPQAGSAVPILGQPAMVAVQVAGVLGMLAGFWVLWGMGVQAWS